MILKGTKNFTQSFYSACCGPRALAILSHYFKLGYSPKGLVKRVSCHRKWGTNTNMMDRMLGEMGLSKRRITKSKFDKNVITAIRRGNPVISLFKTQLDECHYAVIVGYTDRHFIFEDPFFGSKYKRGRGETRILADNGYWWTYEISDGR